MCGAGVFETGTGHISQQPVACSSKLFLFCSRQNDSYLVQAVQEISRNKVTSGMSIV